MKIKDSESGRVLTIVLIIILVITVISAFWIKQNIYTNPFKQVVLTMPEKKVLDDKISLLEKSAYTSRNQQNLQPASVFRTLRILSLQVPMQYFLNHYGYSCQNKNSLYLIPAVYHSIRAGGFLKNL